MHTPQTAEDRKALSLAMKLSLIIGVVMFIMKVGAYLLTGSAAILSDAAESVVHVFAVIFAFYSLRLSYQPADEDHMYGHAKISFFSAGFEGAMIILAALFILGESVHSWMSGIELQHLGYGTLITVAAFLINGVLGIYVLALGRKKKSLILIANGQHVLTDCWTSLAVIVGLILVLTTKWLPFDPLCGIIMACNILWTGWGLIKNSYTGLMDKADPAVVAKLKEYLATVTGTEVTYHHLRYRHLGDAHWVELHLIFPEGISLTKAHQRATVIEEGIAALFEESTHVSTHLECKSDHDQLHQHS